MHGVEWLYRVREDGRFATFGSPRDRKTKAHMVQKRPGLYTEGQHLWAAAVLAGDPAADAVHDDLGVIPEVEVACSNPNPTTAVSGAQARTTPRVSVIIPAFNLARYLPAAIESALGQDPPGGSIEVIVVDDGSTDDTPRVLDSFSDRVKVIRQPNGGLVSAVDRGLAAVTGEYVALLDADDEWPRDRLRRHAAILDGTPTLGLVHGDMEVIDAHGQTLHPSFFAQQQLEPTAGRVLGRLLARNFVSGGASTFRASLLPAVHPIGTEAAYPDWWIAACIATVAEIAHVGAIANRYRFHGANMGLGVTPERRVAIYRMELPWRRWMMRHLVEDDTVSVDDVGAALQAWRLALREATSGEPGGARALLGGDREAAGDLAPPIGPLAPSSKALLRALSRDPFDGAIAVDLEVALLRESKLPPPAPSPPLISLRARSELTIGWLHELLDRPWLLRAFAAKATSESDATLAVLAPPGADLAGLIALVEGDEALRDERCDITVLSAPATPPARALLAARASSRLTAGPSAEPYGSLPLSSAVEAVSRAA